MQTAKVNTRWAVREAHTTAELRALAYLRAECFYDFQTERSKYAQRVRTLEPFLAWLTHQGCMCSAAQVQGHSKCTGANSMRATQMQSFVSACLRSAAADRDETSKLRRRASDA
jgi:hypothetical protein